MDGIYGGISQPDIGNLFRELGASTSYEQFTSLVRQAQGSAGLMRFLELELDTALALDPQAQASAGLGLVRLIAGNPVTMGEMSRHVPDAGSYAPVTLLIQELRDGGTRIAYDSVVSELAIYEDPAATQVAESSTQKYSTFCAKCLGCRPTRPPKPHAHHLRSRIGDCSSRSQGELLLPGRGVMGRRLVRQGVAAALTHRSAGRMPHGSDAVGSASSATASQAPPCRAL